MVENLEVVLGEVPVEALEKLEVVLDSGKHLKEVGPPRMATGLEHTGSKVGHMD